jgi:hypothetical protein
VSEKQPRIEFELPEDQVEALEKLAGTRMIRLSGEIREGRLVIDSVAFADDAFSKPLYGSVNAPFKAVEAAMT